MTRPAPHRIGLPAAIACLGLGFGPSAARAQVVAGSMDYGPFLAVPTLGGAALAILVFAMGSLVAFRARRSAGRAAPWMTMLAGGLMAGAVASALLGASQLHAVAPLAMTLPNGGSVSTQSCTEQTVSNSSGVTQSVLRVRPGTGYAQQASASPACLPGATIENNQSCSLRFGELTPAQAGAAQWVALRTTERITDITTNKAVGEPSSPPNPPIDAARAALEANLQSALYLPMISTPMTVEETYGCMIEVDLPPPVYGANQTDVGAIGCWSVEYLFSEISACTNGGGERRFLVDAKSVGVSRATVDIRAQLGGKNLYYPGAYTASGLFTDGIYNGTTGKWEGSIVFRTRLSGKNGLFQPTAGDTTGQATLSGNPIIGGFVFTPLQGCTILRPDNKPQATSGGGTAFTVELGASSTLPPNVRIVNCGVSKPGSV